MLHSRQWHKAGADLRDFERDILGGPLPFIPGSWLFVDPGSGSDGSDGVTVDEALASFEAAYALAQDGDGICLISSGATSAATTSYLKKPLDMSKNGITVVGAAAPVAMFGRARIANKEALSSAVTVVVAEHTITRTTGSFLTDGWEVGCKGQITSNSELFTVTVATALVLTVTESLTPIASGAQTLTSYMSQIITVSGANNRFFNVHIGNFSSHALSLGGLKITGPRNFGAGVHVVGAGHATPGAVATASSLLLDGAEEPTFVNSVFGTDSVLKAAANGEIVVDGGCWRPRFYGCEVLSYSATAGKGAIKFVDAAALSGYLLLRGCSLMNWNENALDKVDAAVIGTKPTSGEVAVDNCGFFGFTAIGGAGMSGCVQVANSAAVASGAGGIATSM
jgi:hypothetical protein